jgi:hypothetical protein
MSEGGFRITIQSITVVAADKAYLRITMSEGVRGVED